MVVEAADPGGRLVSLQRIALDGTPSPGAAGHSATCPAEGEAGEPGHAGRSDRETAARSPPQRRGPGVVAGVAGIHLPPEYDGRVRACRLQRQREQRENLWRIVWRIAGAVWAMDPAEYGEVRWNLVGDLASRLRFELLVALDLPVRRIVAHLVVLFDRYGAPLVLKRDNGSNLVHPAVDETCDAYGVLTLTSPPYYPRYNGAIEYAQREIKATVDLLTVAGTSLSTALVTAPVLLNDQPRPCLGGHTASEVFHQTADAFQRIYTLERRKEAKRWIQDQAQSIVDHMSKRGRHTYDAAWRQALENWMLDNGLIEVVQPKSLSPPLCLNLA